MVEVQNNPPFFSIIIPTYNREKLIAATLKSLLSQTFTNFEIIVVDDGGKDNTKQVVESLQDNRITYHWKENGERGAARNFGAVRANGLWLNFFDSDDIAYKNHLEVAYKIILEAQVNVFHTGYEHKINDTVINTMQLAGSLNEKLFRGNILSCNNVFIKRENLKEVKFCEDRLLAGTEDWLLWLQLSSRYEIIGEREITSVIIEHSTRSMITASGNTTLKRGQLIEKYLKEDSLFMKKYSHRLKLIRSEMLTLAALQYAILGQYRFNALKYLLWGIFYDPSCFFKRRTLAIFKYVLFKYQN